MTQAAPPSDEKYFNVKFGDIMSRSWSTMSQRFWACFGGTLVFFVWLILVHMPYALIYYFSYDISAVDAGVWFFFINVFKYFAQIAASVLVFILIGGYWKYMLQVARDEPVTVGVLQEGFSVHTIQLLLVGIIYSIGVSVGTLCCLVVPGVYLAVAWIFAFPLIIDQGNEFWTALENSRRAVSSNWFMVAIVCLLVALLALLGVLLGLVGLLVTLPLGMLALAYTYDDNLAHQRR